MSDETVAAELNADPAYVRAIRFVETGGRRDAAAGSAVRFEPHVFWRNKLGMPSGSTGAQIRDALTPVQLAQVPYTPCNTAWRAAHGLPPCRMDRAASALSAETNRAAVERASRVDARQAMLASSWGMFQVLGQAPLDEYGTVPAFLAALDADPIGASERIFVRHMHNKPLALAALRAKNIPLIVSRYNGCCGGTHSDGDHLVRDDGTVCNGCDVYIEKYRRGLRSLEPTAGAAGGGLLLAALGLGLWWMNRRR
jgi:hypothetical protein